MCFSASASVGVGSALVVAGALTLSLTRRRSEVPLALLPLLFGAQQLTEGVVWWSLLHHDARTDARASVVYTLFARVLWPVLVPVAVRCLETVPWRRRALAGAGVLGAGVAVEGLRALLSGGSTARVCGSSVAYASPSLAVIGLYVVATCGAAMVSGDRLLRLTGVVALALALVTWWLYAVVFVSVRCFFCAVLTVMLLGWFCRQRRPRRTARPARAGSPASADAPRTPAPGGW